VEVATLRERRAMKEALAVVVFRCGKECAGSLRARTFEPPAQLVVIREHTAQIRREAGHRLRFALKQMFEEPGRPAHRLARVVEDVVEARKPLDEKLREELDARRVTQVESVDLQALSERRKIRLLRVAIRRIDRKARRDD